MTEKTLPERMREAAEVLNEANVRQSRQSSGWWNSPTLEIYADRWEREDAAKRAEVDNLARLLFEDIGGVWARIDEANKSGWRKRAQTILDAGYRKVEN